MNITDLRLRYIILSSCLFLCVFVAYSFMFSVSTLFQVYTSIVCRSNDIGKITILQLPVLLDNSSCLIICHRFPHVHVDLIHIFPGDIMLHPLFCVHFVIEPPSKTSREAVISLLLQSSFTASSTASVGLLLQLQWSGSGDHCSSQGSGVANAVDVANWAERYGTNMAIKKHGSKPCWLMIIVTQWILMVSLFFAPSKYEGIR